MSRTYRKTTITDEESKARYIERHITEIYRTYKRTYYMTPSGQTAYDAAMAEYNQEYRAWSKGLIRNHPRQPYEHNFKTYCDVKIEYNYEVEAAKLSIEYDKFKRDGELSENGLNAAYKSSCSKELRLANKRLVTKIKRDVDDWDTKSFPDTYLGKQRLWDFW